MYRRISVDPGFITEKIMRNEFESKNDFARRYAGVGHRGAETASGSRPVAESVPGTNRAHNFIKPVAFNGLLTNNLLTALPGEDFARLLPYLEPVSLFCGENL